jgi:hypothetical protein
MIDIEAWERDAFYSGKSEVYQELARGPTWRVGLVARCADRDQWDLLIEVIISLFPEPPKVEIPMLESGLRRIRHLDALGYSLAHEDNGCVSCERKVTTKDFDEKRKKVMAALDRAMK